MASNSGLLGGPPSFVQFPLDAARLRPAVDNVWRRLRGIRALGVGWNMTGVQDEWLILPLWLLPLLTAIPPARWWRARRRASGTGFAVVLREELPNAQA